MSTMKPTYRDLVVDVLRALRTGALLTETKLDDMLVETIDKVLAQDWVLDWLVEVLLGGSRHPDVLPLIGAEMVEKFGKAGIDWFQLVRHLPLFISVFTQIVRGSK